MGTEKLIQTAVVDGDTSTVSTLVANGLKDGRSAEELLSKALTPGILRVGEMFHNGEIFLPEMLMSAKAMTAGIILLEPVLAANETEPIGTVIIGTVQGDLHDIGKNIVGMLMKGAGFKVIDLGVDVPVEKFIEQATEKKAQIVALSALLSTTMPAMKNAVAAIRSSGIGKTVKIMIGGAPVSAAFAEEVGADAYGEDGPEAVNQAINLIA